ncbi:hypothetical protein LTR53_011670 [Teratosphaeriaceae sp. CCFEE 6253]|nr:hypothetical protein LTR53_011670 [Teratosphaeriaceae sp. CCFEE 6253]
MTDAHRPKSMPEMTKRPSRRAFETPPPYLPPRKPASVNPARRPVVPPAAACSLPSIPDVEPPDGASAQPPGSRPARGEFGHGFRHELDADMGSFPRNPRLRALRGEQQAIVSNMASLAATPTLRRHSSLRIQRRPSDEDDVQLTVHPALLAPRSTPCMRSEQPRPYSHPPARAQRSAQASSEQDIHDPRPAPPLPPPLPITRVPLPRPRASLKRLSSLDNIISYREEKAEWKRASSLLVFEPTCPKAFEEADLDQAPPPGDEEVKSEADDETGACSLAEISPPASLKPPARFRSLAAEVGFCFSIAMTQFLGEYLISGFAIALPAFIYRDNLIMIGPGVLGDFWPATLLSLILSATLLGFARLADIHGGYGIFMSGLVWLGIWCLVPGFFPSSLLMLDVARAMQGLSIAAFTPSAFVLVSSFYDAGRRRNLVFGLYGGCAPLGFFAGILTAGALPKHHMQWYLWIAAALAFVAAITAFLTVPRDRTDRKQLGLQMDWLGAFLITAGLILISYALAYLPEANQYEQYPNGFASPFVYGPFVAGMLCLVAALWVEGWYAACPLLPFDFFRPKSTVAVCCACLFFYASYGVWLYTSAKYLGSASGVTRYEYGVHGLQLALWYTPTAVGGLVLCVVGGSLMHVVRLELLLFVSGLAWVAAPLLLAVCPLPFNYWAVVLPSMLCATLGIDLTYTLSLVRLSTTQPTKYQGLAGAVCSILVNLAMAFSLPISEIVQKLVQERVQCDYQGRRAEFEACMNGLMNGAYRAMFLYAAASAGAGLVICVLFVRFQPAGGGRKQVDEERPRETSSESPTLVEGLGEQGAERTSLVDSA